jgi:hypothetical protein
MSNIFEEVLDDVHKVEEKYLGPDYPYYKFIKTPSELGMTDEGSISALAKDIDGLVNYVELLVTGKSNASATGQPLGNKFFLQTGAKCTDKATGQDVDRFIYVDNVPEGNIPFISSGLGVNFSEFKGLIPGAVSDLNVLNPFTVFQAFLSGGKQDCQEITLETIDTYNNRSTQTHFVSLIDLKNMDPCVFPDKTNRFTDPIKTCKETFSSMNKKNKGKTNNTNNSPGKYVFKTPNDPIVQGYFASLGVLGIYILYCLIYSSA